MNTLLSRLKCPLALFIPLAVLVGWTADRAWSGSVLTAGTALKVNLEGLVDRSEVVIEGRVKRATSRPAPGRIETEYEVEVARTFLGEELLDGLGVQALPAILARELQREVVSHGRDPRGPLVDRDGLENLIAGDVQSRRAGERVHRQGILASLVAHRGEPEPGSNVLGMKLRCLLKRQNRAGELALFGVLRGSRDCDRHWLLVGQGLAPSQVANEPIEPVQIALISKSHDPSDGDVSDETHVTELFAGVGVRQVNLDGREPHGEERVPQRHRRMRVRRRVDQHAVIAELSGLLNGVDESSLSVVLRRDDLHLELLAARHERRVDLRQGHAPVALRLSASKQVQVRSVKDSDPQGSAHQARLRARMVERRARNRSTRLARSV